MCSLNLKSVEKPIYKCPFYGFYRTTTWKPNVLFGKEGNSCGFFASSHVPCQMEINRQTPDWNKCPFNKEENEEAIKEIIVSHLVYPKGAREDCISFKQWMDFVMSGG